jgi:hypothetical protein
MNGLNIVMRRGKQFAIRGRVVKPENCLGAGVGLVRDEGRGSSSTGSGLDNPEGTFDWVVTPGSYQATAHCMVGDIRYQASANVVVSNSDVEGIELTPIAPVQLTGTLRIEGNTPLRLNQVRVMLGGWSDANRHAMGGQDVVREDGRFTLKNLPPDRYRLEVFAPAPVYVKSARLGDEDVLESGLNLAGRAGAGELAVVLSANGATVVGTVTDEEGEPAVMAAVVLVPPKAPSLAAEFGQAGSDAETRSLAKITNTNPAGKFVIYGVRPGSYKVFAFSGVNPNAVLYDAEFMKAFAAKGVDVRLGEGGKESMQLKVIVAPDSVGEL